MEAAASTGRAASVETTPTTVELPDPSATAVVAVSERLGMLPEPAAFTAADSPTAVIDSIGFDFLTRLCLDLLLAAAAAEGKSRGLSTRRRLVFLML